jgi:pimeloyl-ACP methyl ester carboxylesterase
MQRYPVTMTVTASSSPPKVHTLFPKGDWLPRGYGSLCRLLLGLIWLLGGCGFSPSYPVTLIPAECPLPVPDELEEGRTITCGYLQVPQDRTAPTGLQVKLPYARIRAESAHPHPDPLVYLAGGPGGSALAEFNQIYAWFRPIRRDRDLILYDQRGTLLADPVLECAGGGPAPTSAEIEAVSARVPAYLHPLDANDVVIARCADRLQAQGIDLAHYDTATHARDLLDLLAALGYAEYNFYGTSYGTRIALEVMRLAPPGLRAVVLDSIYPPTINAYEIQHSIATLEVLARAFDQCAGQPACAAAYPDLATRFDQAIDELNAQPLDLPLSWQPTFDGNALLQLMLTRLDSALLPYLPRLVDEVGRGESSTLVALLRGEVPPPTPPRAMPISAADEARVTEFVLTLNGAFLTQQLQLDDEAMQEWQQLTARNADRTRLSRFIESHLPPAIAKPLLAQVAQLTDADLALVFAELRSVPVHPLTRGANLAVECRDEQPFNDYRIAISAHQALGIPDALVADELMRLRHHWAQCALFPTGVAASSQTEPVTSSIPALIFQGGLDTITPPSWAAAAQRTLSNATYFEFPGQGHVVIQQPLNITSDCPAQLTRQFLDDPSHAPDATCVSNSYQIPWVLPDAPSP